MNEFLMQILDTFVTSLENYLEYKDEDDSQEIASHSTRADLI